MTNVVLIGTCRILHPIETLEDINILNEPNLPFVHNTSEVIQRMNYLQGNYSYPSELSSYQLNGQPPSLIPNVSIKEVDLFIIEISSAKIINYGEHQLQLNNLTNYMKELGEVGKDWLTQLRDISSQHTLIYQKRQNLLNNLSEIDRKVMSESLARVQSKQQLFLDLEKIVALTEGKVIFVTHINATPPQKINIAARTNLIQNVIEFCEINNAEYINPTELFHQYPQEIVLDKNGEDINHYNKEFIPTVGKYFAERIAMKRD